MEERSWLTGPEDIFEAAPDPLLDVRPRPRQAFRPSVVDSTARMVTSYTTSGKSREQALRQSWAAHPSQFGREVVANPPMVDVIEAEEPWVVTTGKSRMLAVLFALFAGYYGMHNFYLGYSRRGWTNLALWFACALATLATVNLLFMLPIASLVMVESAQIGLGIGAYRADASGNRLN